MVGSVRRCKYPIPLHEETDDRPYVLASAEDEIRDGDGTPIVDIERVDGSVTTLDGALSPDAAAGVLAAVVEMIDHERREERTPEMFKVAEQIVDGDIEGVRAYTDREGNPLDSNAMARLIAGSVTELIPVDVRASVEVTAGDIHDTLSKMMGYGLYQSEIDEMHRLVTCNTVEDLEKLFGIVEGASEYTTVKPEWRYAFAEAGLELTPALLRKLEIVESIKQHGKTLKLDRYETELLPTVDGTEFALQAALIPNDEGDYDYANLAQILRSQYLLRAPHSENDRGEEEVESAFAKHFGYWLGQLLGAAQNRNKEIVDTFVMLLKIRTESEEQRQARAERVIDWDAYPVFRIPESMESAPDYLRKQWPHKSDN